MCIACLPSGELPKSDPFIFNNKGSIFDVKSDSKGSPNEFLFFWFLRDCEPVYFT
ncbi:hypothetical protein MACK_003704 [Theileria orientalis]|uniref:Uncharacterized protein n=1 Tax=Theileria orientalis TaxID=68886 RepID=A0A976SIN9_THEOR|nr:hypothetical protein MACK_003704 [Theileria orientalis]